MPVVKNKDNDENREFWSHVEAIAKEVNTWPQWMGNESKRRTNDADRAEHPQNNEKLES